jgi:membrane fusion protein (multidrug efflux system)
MSPSAACSWASACSRHDDDDDRSLEQVWVEANFKETQLAKMRIGQPVEAAFRPLRRRREFDGKLDSLGLGTGSAFALLPAQNASGNWIKIVQRVPVRIEIDRTQLAAASAAARPEHARRRGAARPGRRRAGHAPQEKPCSPPRPMRSSWRTRRADQNIVRENLAQGHG